MGYERYPRGNDPQRGYEGRDDVSDYGSTEDRYGYSGGREYRAAGWSGAGARDNGLRDYGRTDEQRGYGAPRSGNWGDHDDGGRSRFTGGQDYYRSGQDGGSRDYARDPYRQARGTYDRQPQDYRDRGRDGDRGFFDRAGDEVRSWFGDEDAERRREADARRDEQAANHRDAHYHDWRSQQIASFDRDYDEYRRENRSKFHNEFSSWRTDRQGQRDLLNRVEEHADVVGSDGEHVGTVDKVRGDRIILTKKDADAGGHHHSIPSNWLQSADGGTVTLRKTAAEAKARWRDEERNGAIGGQTDEQRGTGESGATSTSRSFSGSY